MGGEEGNVCAMNVAATDFLLGVVYNFRLDDWSIRDVCRWDLDLESPWSSSFFFSSFFVWSSVVYTSGPLVLVVVLLLLLLLLCLPFPSPIWPAESNVAV